MAKLSLSPRLEEVGSQQRGRLKNVKSPECYMAVNFSSSLAFGCPSAPLACIFCQKLNWRSFPVHSPFNSYLDSEEGGRAKENSAPKKIQPVSSEASAWPRALHPGTTASCQSDAGPTTLPLYLLLPSTDPDPAETPTGPTCAVSYLSV